MATPAFESLSHRPRRARVATERAGEPPNEAAGTPPAPAPPRRRCRPVRVAGRPFQDWCHAWATECLRVLKPGGMMLSFGGTRTWHRSRARSRTPVSRSATASHGSTGPASQVARRVQGDRQGGWCRARGCRRRPRREGVPTDNRPSHMQGLGHRPKARRRTLADRVARKPHRTRGGTVAIGTSSKRAHLRDAEHRRLPNQPRRGCAWGGGFKGRRSVTA